MNEKLINKLKNPPTMGDACDPADLHYQLYGLITEAAKALEDLSTPLEEIYERADEEVEDSRQLLLDL